MARTKKEPVVHKDFLGNVINLGDAVVFSASGRGSLYEGKISKVSKVTVNVGGCRKYPDEVVKVPEEILLTRLLTGEAK